MLRNDEKISHFSIYFFQNEWRPEGSPQKSFIVMTHFPRYWPIVRGIHWSPMNSPHKGEWCRALMFSLICVWINGWVNNREAGDLRRHCAHCDVIVMINCIQGKSKHSIKHVSHNIFQYFVSMVLTMSCSVIVWFSPFFNFWVSKSLRKCQISIVLVKRRLPA